MITIQGVAVNTKNAEGPIQTKGDSFLPVAVNVSGKKDKADWQTLRIYARETSELETLRAHLANKKSLIVRSISNLFTRTYEKDGETRATASFSANLRQVEGYDNEGKTWSKLTDLVGLSTPGASAPSGETEVDDLPAEALPF